MHGKSIFFLNGSSMLKTAKFEAGDGGYSEWRKEKEESQGWMKNDCQRDLRMERTVTTADVRGQTSGGKMLIWNVPVQHGGGAWLSNWSRPGLWPRRFGHLIIKNFWARNSMYKHCRNIFRGNNKIPEIIRNRDFISSSSPSLPSSLFLDLTPASAPVVLMLAWKKHFYYTNFYLNRLF